MLPTQNDGTYVPSIKATLYTDKDTGEVKT